MLMIGVMPLPALMNSSEARRRVGQREVTLDAAEAHDRPGPRRLHQVGRDLAGAQQLRGDRDEPVGTARVRGQRIGAPVVHAVDDDADAQELAGLVSRPHPAGPDHDRHAVGGLALDRLDPAAQLAAGPQRVDQLQVVVGQQRREQHARGSQQPAPGRRDVRSCAALSQGPRHWVGHQGTSSDRRKMVRTRGSQALLPALVNDDLGTRALPIARYPMGVVFTATGRHACRGRTAIKAWQRHLTSSVR